MLVQQSHYLSCRCGHIQCRQIILFLPHTTQIPHMEEHIAFLQSCFLFAIFLILSPHLDSKTKSCGCLHSLSVNRTLHPVHMQTLPLIAVRIRGLDFICSCSFSYGTLSMPMSTSGSSSLDSSSVLSIFLFFPLFLLTCFCWKLESLKVLGTQCFVFLFGTKKSSCEPSNSSSHSKSMSSSNFSLHEDMKSLSIHFSFLLLCRSVGPFPVTFPVFSMNAVYLLDCTI